MKVKDVMSAPVVAVPPASTVRDVAKHMDYSGVGCVLVTDGQSALGVVTDRDLVLRALAPGLPADTPVAEVMTPAPVTARPGDELDLAFEVFRRNAFRRLPVVEDGQVIGMLTLDDLLLHLHQVGGDLLKPVVAEISEPQHPRHGAS
ncbi:CBS domain-containing protein [Actinomadura sp. ATCC 31491]|uniref:CBS domain-containing protein n=1 Tax=Actinomadura luzonensis TaxID=2805427 RepID=A0ABT0G4G3_9ACTN|nr:CBS domain-containing protein [Actinomadura luzonensis]MCK2219457.1 CBS domain-containing protein [Actinomadura luzonensis]